MWALAIHLLSVSIGAWAACHPTCLACETSLSISCVTCYLHAHTQLVTPSLCVCDSGYFPSPDSRNCLGCHPSCSKCSGSQSNKCTSCPSTAKLKGPAPNECVCITGWPNPGVDNCVSCHSTCATCSGPGPNDCSSCLTGRSLAGPAPSTCICPSGTFPDPTPATCSLCANECRSCAGTSSTACLSCKTNAELSGPAPNGCVCRQGFFGSPGSCTACHGSCLTCSGGSASNCESCKLNAILSATSCTCAPTYFPNPTSQFCTPCSALCVTCQSGLPSACITCPLHASLKTAAPGTCYCDLGFVGQPDVSNCMQCHGSCETCSGVTALDCISCKANAIASAGACACATGFYPNPDPSHCSQCDLTCATCASATECVTCKTHATKTYYNACVCDPGYYVESGSGGCALCHPACKTCIAGTSSSCLSCFSNAQISTPVRPGACICSVGFYGSPDAGNCQPCPSTCRACSSGFDYGCTACFAGAELVGAIAPSYCVCSSGYTGIASNCQACSPSCLSCAGVLSSDCVSCHLSASLTATAPSQCSCDSGYFPSPGAWNCVKCSVTCAVCVSGLLSGCSSCHTNAILAGPPPNSCVCKLAYFPDPDSSHCSSCDITCLTCSDPFPQSCLSCRVNAVVGTTPGKCVCVAGFFMQSGQCLPCSRLCTTCINDSESGCTSCPPHSSLLSQTASLCECSSGYYPDPDVSKCSKCPAGCTHCSGAKSCWSCDAAFTLVSGVCTACPAHCSVCEPNLSCIQCEPGLYKHNSGVCKVCELCHTPLAANITSPYDHIYTVRFNRDIAAPLTQANLVLATEPQSDFNWTFTNEPENLIKVKGGPWMNTTEFIVEIVGDITDEFGGQLSTRWFELQPPLNSTVLPPPPPSTVPDPTLLPSSSNITMRSITETSSSVIVSSAVASGVGSGGAGMAVQLMSKMQYFAYIADTQAQLSDDSEAFFQALNQRFWMPNLFVGEVEEVGRRLSSSSPDHDFLETAGPFLSLLVLLCTFHAFLHLFCVALLPEKKWIYSIKSQFEWTLYFYLYAFAYLDLLVSSLLQLKVWTLSALEAKSMLCTIVAAVITTVSFLTPLALTWVLWSQNNSTERWSFALPSVQTKGRGRYYYPVFFLQRLVYAIAIVTCADSPKLQTTLFVGPVALMAGFVLLAKPMPQRVERVLQVIAEFDALAVFLLLCICTVRGTTIGEYTTWLLISLTLKSFCCSMLMLALAVYRRIKEWRERWKARMQVAPVLETNTKEITTVEDYNVSFGPEVRYPRLFHRVGDTQSTPKAAD